MPDIEKVKMPLPQVVAAGCVIISAIWIAATWTYDHVAGPKDVDSIDSRLTKVITWSKEEQAKGIQATRDTEMRLQMQMNLNKQEEIEVHKQILSRLDSIDSFLRSGSRHVRYEF